MMPALFGRKLAVSHIWFSIAFTLLIYVVCNIANFDKIAQWFYDGESLNLAAVAAFYIVGYGLFLIVFLLLCHPGIVKPISILFIFLSLAGSYFINKYDISIDRTMVMNTVFTDSGEVTALLSSQMIPSLVFAVVLSLFILFKLRINFRPLRWYIPKSVFACGLTLVLSAVLLYSNFNALHRAGNISRKQIIYKLVPINIVNSSYSAASDYLEPYFDKNKEEVEIVAQLTEEKNLTVVLAIGETSRQKSMSLYGYDRVNTSPLLSEVDGLLALNGIARKGSTLYALPEILEKDDIKLPALVSAVGIDSACYVNYTLYDNCSTVGEVHVTECKYEEGCYDEDVIPLLEDNLVAHDTGSNFIVLHLGGGSHGPSYEDRHPAEYIKFKPTCTDADVVNQCSKEELYNTYDNTMLYVDYVLNEILQSLESSGDEYVFIFVSDHGESLLEGGRIFHGMPPSIPLPPEQAQVPLLVKSSMPISIKERDEYLQQDIYSTVLSLFAIDSPVLDENRSFIEVR